MDSFDDLSESDHDAERDDASGQLEVTDIESDEHMDGDVDADGASAIPRRNE